MTFLSCIFRRLGCSLVFFVGSVVSYNSSPRPQFLKAAIHSSVSEAFFNFWRTVVTEEKQPHRPQPLPLCELSPTHRICHWCEWHEGSKTKRDMLCAQTSLYGLCPGRGSVSSRADLSERPLLEMSHLFFPLPCNYLQETQMTTSFCVYLDGIDT